MTINDQEEHPEMCHPLTKGRDVVFIALSMLTGIVLVGVVGAAGCLLQYFLE